MTEDSGSGDGHEVGFAQQAPLHPSTFPSTLEASVSGVMSGVVDVLHYGPSQIIHISNLVQRRATGDQLVRQYVVLAKTALLACKSERQALFDDLDADRGMPLTLDRIAKASSKSERGSPWWPGTVEELTMWVHLMEMDVVDTANRQQIRPVFSAITRRLLLKDSLGGAVLDEYRIVTVVYQPFCIAFGYVKTV